MRLVAAAWLLAGALASRAAPPDATGDEPLELANASRPGAVHYEVDFSAVSGGKAPVCVAAEPSKQRVAWKCQGLQAESFPDKLEPRPTSLRLVGTGIETLKPNSLQNYRDTLRDFSIENAPRLSSIEPSTFALLNRLRVIYIFQAPKLAAFDLAGKHPDLTIIRIQQTSLRYWPDMTLFRQERILSSLDLDNNHIVSLGLKPINIRTELLNLEFNQIRQIDNFTFNGSEIGTLLLNNNRQLSHIHPNAFANLKNLIKLDLSSTSVTQLPTIGLHQLRTLLIRDTYTLRQIPSIYVFPVLAEARLTYAHHCCSFRYPQTHDPSTYEEHLRLQAKINERCWKQGLAEPEPERPAGSSLPTTPGSEFEGVFESEQRVAAGERLAVAGGRLSIQVQRLLYNIECGELTLQQDALTNVTCTPEPDAFNPCEDIMGYPFLRVVVWFVVGASWFGNLAAIVVLACIFQRLTAPQFLQLNLAVADFFMGVYLASLALADLTTRGDYFNHAIDWQQGLGCKFAGASSLFASQLSIYTLCIITFERYYTITYSIDLNKRLNLGWAVRFMLVGWLYAFASAMLPIFANVNSYSMTSICLPLRTGDHWDKIFLMVLLLIDTLAFVIIFACYLKMYLLIVRQKTQANTQDRKVAKRMALLVATDFACWAPIIFYGMTALLGWPLISVTNSKILIVFFYPLNAMANPYMYVLSTRRYKREFNYLALKLRNWRRGLFRTNDDSFYQSQTAAHAKPANLSAQLGAVAAVTGVARRMRRSHTLVGGASLLLEPAGGRLVCSKTHKGSYIIRHQILTERATASWHLQRRPAARARPAGVAAAAGGAPGRPASPQRAASAQTEPPEARPASGDAPADGCSRCCRLCSRAPRQTSQPAAKPKATRETSGDKSTLVSILQPASSASGKRLSAPAVRIDPAASCSSPPTNLDSSPAGLGVPAHRCAHAACRGHLSAHRRCLSPRELHLHRRRRHRRRHHHHHLHHHHHQHRHRCQRGSPGAHSSCNDRHHAQRVRQRARSADQLGLAARPPARSQSEAIGVRGR